MTEKEINEKYGQTAANLGQRFYVLCLPVIEIVESLAELLKLNREMSKLKQAEALKKAEEDKPAAS